MHFAAKPLLTPQVALNYIVLGCARAAAAGVYPAELPACLLGAEASGAEPVYHLVIDYLLTLLTYT